MTQRIQKHIDRTPEDIARLRALREQIQSEQPSPDDLRKQGHTFLPLGEALGRRAILAQLREERKRQNLTLRELAERSGIDEPALSRLENGQNANPTLDTLDRVTAALGKVLHWQLLDKETPRPPNTEPPQVSAST